MLMFVKKYWKMLGVVIKFPTTASEQFKFSLIYKIDESSFSFLYDMTPLENYIAHTTQQQHMIMSWQGHTFGDFPAQMTSNADIKSIL